MTVVVGTAGHIDHGKTALLRALTGIDPDRLPEERRRGMTIDVGYAHLRLPDGTDLDFVDVPGHDRLVGNMLVGAGEIEAVLLVVAANDGPRAQTIEHLELLDALGIRDGIVAITKVDMVDSRRVGEVSELVGVLLAGTSLAGSPIVPVSSVNGSGLAELSSELLWLRDRVLGHAPPAAIEDPVRLAIDRSFVIKGRGAVVTGSLRGGGLERGVLLRLVPGDRVVRARELQVHGGAVEALMGGGRVALNLAGIDASELVRGAVLTTDPRLQASSALIAELRSPRGVQRAGPGSPGRAAIGRPEVQGSTSSRAWPLPPGAAFRLHLGTEQVQATLGRGRADLVPLPDGRVVARLRLDRPIALATGDRFVLRRSAAGSPAIGGLVLDPGPPIGPARRRVNPGRLVGLASSDPIERSSALLNLHGVLDPARLSAGDRVAAPADEALWAIRLADRLIALPIAAALEAEALVAVANGARSAPLGPGISRAALRTTLVRGLRRAASVDQRSAGAIIDGLLARLVAAGRLEREGDLLREPGALATLQPAVIAAMDRLEQALAIATPPALATAVLASGCPPEGVRALESAGRIVRLDDDLAYAASQYGELARTALAMARQAALTPSAYRDATGTSRKYVMAILEELDRRGILRRTADGHVPGPRAGPAGEVGRTVP
jgi:selenocysteine-specific elongation factor